MCSRSSVCPLLPEEDLGTSAIEQGALWHSWHNSLNTKMSSFSASMDGAQSLCQMPDTGSSAWHWQTVILSYGLLRARLTPEGHIFSRGSFIQAVIEASNDNNLNFKFQREGGSCHWDTCFVTSATGAVQSALWLLDTVREFIQSFSERSCNWDSFFPKNHWNVQIYVLIFR